MSQATLEHVNITVTDPKRSADLFESLCGWTIRWEGPSKLGGHTIHVGGSDSYLAIYTNENTLGDFKKGTPLNHIGVAVDDIELAEKVVRNAGLKPFSHGTYNPGPQSFYFFDWDGIEFEVVSYE